MSSKEIQTPFGTALPPAQRHAITVHLPAWESILRFKDHDPEIFARLKSMYPRFVLHKDILELSQKIITFASNGQEDKEQQGCYIFPSLQAAQYCITFATSPTRGKDGTIPEDKINLRVFKTSRPDAPLLYAVLFPAIFTDTVHSFWLNAGTGISSRLAEDTLTYIDSLEEVKVKPDTELPPATTDRPAHTTIKSRISSLMNRAPSDPSQTTRHVSPDDVYLFTTGMSAIYWVHRFLLNNHRQAETRPSILFGFSFHSTVHVLEDHGPGVEFFGLGDWSSADYDALSTYLSTHKVQAIYTEFPSNPLLTTPSLAQLRKLADEHDTLLIVDDTIGSFINVDVLPHADIVVSSLTKSFSGYADVMAGSAVLNPKSPRYSELKHLFSQEYHSDVYVGDAEALEVNSRDYVARSGVLNANAATLVSFLQQKAEDPKSAVTRVFYPTTTVVGNSGSNYTPALRQSIPSFPYPSYGCLFSVEFHDQASTIAFYDSLHVHKGPHLGAHLTLALPYSVGIYGNDLEWAAKYHIRPTQIRISVGLEDTEALVATFRSAVEEADRGWEGESN